MDPISLAIGAVGLGMQIFGSAKSSSDASKYNEQENALIGKENAVSAQQTANAQDQARQEQSISDQKQQAMEVAGRRQQLEIVRTNQRQRAAAIQAGTNQGAQFGSGLQGGLAQIDNESAFNLTGVNSSLMTGRAIAGFNQNITNDRIAGAGLQGQMNLLKSNEQSVQGNEKSALATDQGYASMGGALMKAGPMIGPLGSSAFSGLKGLNLGSGLMGGGSPSGYGA